MIDLSTLNNNDLFHRLNEIIQQKFGSSPSLGIVAGQAVASALFEHIGLGQGPYNDIDTFVHYDQAPHCPHYDDPNPIAESGEPRRTGIKRSFGRNFGITDPSISSGSLGISVIDPISCNGYSVNYSHYDLGAPYINYVRISPDNIPYEKVRTAKAQGYSALSGYAELILNGFDINACQIALDLKAGTVVWTDEFQNFLYHKQLKSTFLGTPMHTAVRLLRKRNDLAFASLDLDEEMSKLQTARQVFIHIEHARELESGDYHMSYLPGNLFSQVYYQRAMEHMDTLSRYFKLETKPCSFDDSYINEENEEVEQRVVKDMFVLTPTNYDESLVGHYNEIFPFSTYYRRNCEKVNRFLPVLMALMKGEKNRKAVAKFVKERAGLFDVALSKEEAVLSEWWTISHLNDGFQACRRLSKKQMDAALNTYKRHPDLISTFVYDEKINTYDLLCRAKLVNWLDKNNLSYYVGWLETNAFKLNSWEKDHKHIVRTHALKKAHYVSMDDPDFRTKIKARSETFFKEAHQYRRPHRIQETLTKVMSKHPTYELRELSSYGELLQEGIEMRHCVGGYYQRIEEGYTIIVALADLSSDVMDRSNRSTLEIRFTRRAEHSDLFEAVRGQLYSYRNETAPDGHDDMAKCILQSINKKLEQFDFENSASGDGHDELYRFTQRHWQAGKPTVQKKEEQIAQNPPVENTLRPCA